MQGAPTGAMPREKTMAGSNSSSGFVAGLCPTCGAQIQVPEGSDRCFCAYCGAQVFTAAALAFADVSIKGEVQTRAVDFDIQGGKLLDYNGREVEVVIPSDVTVIGRESFAGLAVTKLTIPSSVREIEEGAFSGCRYLTSVTFSEGLQSIGAKAFAGTALKEARLPSTLKVIAPRAFSHCWQLRLVVLPKGLAILGMRAFESCLALSSIAVPPGVKEIGECTFWNCKSLKSVLLRPGLRTVGTSAFGGCVSLEQIILPETCTSVGSGSFRGCRSLTTASIPTGCALVGVKAFEGCGALSKVTIPGRLCTPESFPEFYPKALVAKWKREGRCSYCGGMLILGICTKCKKMKNY